MNKAMKKNKRQTVHYAWKIMAACIMIKLGSSGAIHAAMSNFVAPIVEELGCQVSELTMFTSIQAVAMALLYTTAAKLLTTRRPGLIIGAASVVEISGLALMASYRSVTMFYLSGALIGIAQAFSGFVAMPILLNMWFKKKNGTVLGIVTAVGTAATMGYSLLSGQLITSFGWRWAYLIMALMSAVITIPAVFILIKSPEEVGCEPYGIEEAEKKVMPGGGEAVCGLSKKEAFKLPLLYLAWTACVFYSYGSGVQGYITPFATMELHQTVNFGAMAAVIVSLGGTFSSLIVGRINDRFGVKAGLAWGAVTTGIGYTMMFLSYTNPLFLYPAAFITGLGSSMYMVQCPLLAGSIVGDKQYSEIWALMMMVNSLIGGGLYSSIGLFYDRFGSYSGAFLMGIILYVAAGAMGMISVNRGKKKGYFYESNRKR